MRPIYDDVLVVRNRQDEQLTLDRWPALRGMRVVTENDYRRVEGLRVRQVLMSPQAEPSLDLRDVLYRGLIACGGLTRFTRLEEW